MSREPDGIKAADSALECAFTGKIIRIIVPSHADWQTTPRFGLGTQPFGVPLLTVIDEVQKVPALLDEVHWLIERRGATFLLNGSSARKLLRGHANLLAGRAGRFEMGPLSATSFPLPPDWSQLKLREWGLWIPVLPRVERRE